MAKLGHKSVGQKSRDLLAEQTGESARNIQRYIRLTELIPELLDMVDERKIALNPAYELSLPQKRGTEGFLDAIESEQLPPLFRRPSGSRNTARRDNLTLDMMRVIMGEEKKSDLDKVTLPPTPCESISPRATHPSGCRRPLSNCWNSAKKAPARPGTMKGAAYEGYFGP